ncbi:MAG: TetR family transcriptional regulator [Nocardioides marinisabuli]|uniref:acyl-CoA-like ligand-binding transcription factor n=1 Tax=Nocardioides marinisabuli TaxID=419476 RepID=UPI0032192A0E
MDAAQSTIGRRERKKRETRRALRESALRLFAERGFERTTVADITEAADVAQRTFFLHFCSKEDVLLADAAERDQVFSAALAAQPDDTSPLEAVRSALRALVGEGVLDHEELMLRARLMEEAPSVLARNLEQYTGLEDLISRDAASRLGQDARLDTYPVLLGALTMTALRVAISLWYRRGGTGDLATYVDEALDELSAGLVAPQPT